MLLFESPSLEPPGPSMASQGCQSSKPSFTTRALRKGWKVLSSKNFRLPRVNCGAPTTEEC